MNMLMINLTIIVIICCVMLMLIFILSKKYSKSMMKLSPFECGFNPMNNNRIPFSIHFFLISIIFLIFDVEITLIIPMILIYYKSNLIMWYSICLYFFMLLIFSLYYEWKIKMLMWTN
uniref:NADH-ubiquinone oxidoreductase chain 3 n=1 Tax=Ceraclea indistincta TaxID=2904887 RepID=A0A9E8LNQ7_9NEOP|nr:NADH dehydrogenase subunit 3 [Ceraclea indistincta]UZZ43824.1 NADH dehydrogenase subunit 3 [Ceraclea indistincta]